MATYSFDEAKEIYKSLSFDLVSTNVLKVVKDSDEWVYTVPVGKKADNFKVEVSGIEEDA